MARVLAAANLVLLVCLHVKADADSSESPDPCPQAPTASIGTSAGKVYSIGDLHGDYDRFKLILEGLGLATFKEQEIQWTGGNAILVSLGDIVDRGEHSRPIYLALQHLAREAANVGGEVVKIIGNHELMNMGGDWRYVPAEETSPDGDYGGVAGRKKDWSRGGLIWKDVCKCFVTAAVRSGTLFVHAGLKSVILRDFNDSLDQVNAQVRKQIEQGRFDQTHHKLFTHHTGPFWPKAFESLAEGIACKMVEETLKIVGAKRMVIGHCPQANGVFARCSGASGPQLILSDTFISRAFLKERSESRYFPHQKGVKADASKASAVEYDGSRVKVHYFNITQTVPIELIEAEWNETLRKSSEAAEHAKVVSQKDQRVNVRGQGGGVVQDKSSMGGKVKVKLVNGSIVHVSADDLTLRPASIFDLFPTQQSAAAVALLMLCGASYFVVSR